MKLRQLTIALALVGASSVGIVSCGGSSNDYPELSATIEIFDGYAIGCDATVNGVAASEEGNGVYTFRGELSDGDVVSATGCTDADTGTALSTLQGVGVSGSAVVSPFTTMIVSLAQSRGGDPASLSASAISSAKSTIVSKLGLGSYDPTNPRTANYVSKAATNATAGAVMQKALTITTLLKAVEKLAGSANAAAAVSAVTQALEDTSGTLDLTSSAALDTLLDNAAVIASSVAMALTDAKAITTKVAQIASAPSVGAAAAITQVVGESLDDDEQDIDDAAGTDTDDLEPIDVGTGSGNEGDGDDDSSGSSGGSGGSS
ncbi:MAG: hypothetical protein MI976_15620 [Pseudomonadales bacterium]|nr:hypothetical protein [Pseudomonadales bacterium]